MVVKVESLSAEGLGLKGVSVTMRYNISLPV